MNMSSIFTTKYPIRSTLRLMSISNTKSKIENSNLLSTVDDKEIDHHGKIAAYWWDKKGPMIPLHTLNKLRVPLVRDGLLSTMNINPDQAKTSTPLKDVNILEVGCGGGLLTEPLARIGASVTGLDASSELISVAKSHAAKSSRIYGKLNYVCESIENFATTNIEKYDAVVLSEVIEHITEKDLFIDSCVKTLKPGGSIFITTLNKTNIAWALGIVVAENINLIPKGTHEWEKFISPNDCQQLLKQYNCTTKLVHGMFYQPLINRWFWCETTMLSYALHAVKQPNNIV